MSALYHPGEVRVQQAAGLRAEAAQVARIVSRRLSPGAAAFLSGTGLLVLSGLDPDGRCWVTARRGCPGFVRATAGRVHVTGGLAAPDPLAGAGPGRPVGMVAIDLSRRRRLRVNGTIESAGPDGMTVAVGEAYGNCPRYIDSSARVPSGPCSLQRSGRELSGADIALVSGASYFFVGSAHPQAGSDASHRGGRPGFVRVPSPGELVFPDYDGNAMFNTLGNLIVNPAVGLLFLTAGGDRLQLTGRAEVRIPPAGPPGAGQREVMVRIDGARRWRLAAAP